jgi:hypothetical protein
MNKIMICLLIITLILIGGCAKTSQKTAEPTNTIEPKTINTSLFTIKDSRVGANSKNTGSRGVELTVNLPFDMQGMTQLYSWIDCSAGWGGPSQSPNCPTSTYYLGGNMVLEIRKTKQIMSGGRSDLVYILLKKPFERTINEGVKRIIGNIDSQSITGAEFYCFKGSSNSYNYSIIRTIGFKISANYRQNDIYLLFTNGSQSYELDESVIEVTSMFNKVFPNLTAVQNTTACNTLLSV